MDREKIIVGNWKMNKTNEEAIELVRELKEKLNNVNATVVVCPPFTALSDVQKEINKSNIKLGAQDICFEESGAFTGEISAKMIRSCGCEYVVLGHSERRQYFKEKNDIINKKIKTALKNNLKVILCVGETLKQREDEETEKIIEKQLTECLEKIENISNIIIAYEPVWAIGTSKTALPEQAQEAHSFIRALIKEIYDEKTAEENIILYGGSIKPNNIRDLMKQQDIDGALVGGSSLEAESFAQIINLS